MLYLNFDPFPILETGRLRLRRVTQADRPEMFDLRRDPAIMRFIPRPLAKTEEDAGMHIQKIEDGIAARESINWGISLKSDPKLVGMIGFVRMKKEHFRAEVGYLLALNQQGKGIMKEALKAVISYGFDTINLHSIEAIVDPLNTSSSALLERCGFVKEGQFKDHEYYEGRFMDTVVYSHLTHKPDHKPWLD